MLADAVHDNIIVVLLHGLPVGVGVVREQGQGVRYSPHDGSVGRHQGTFPCLPLRQFDFYIFF